MVFSWIEPAVLRPIAGVKKSSSLYWIEPRTDTGSYPGASWREFQDLGDRLRTLRDLLAFRMLPLYLCESGRVERAYGLLVSGNYFSALGLRPALGRFFTPEDVAHPGDPPFVVISHELWQTRFQGSPDALGRSLRVNGREIAVIGVAPRGFHGTMPHLAFDPELPLYDIRTLNEHIEANLLFRRIAARMLSVLGPLLLVLVTIGLYALVDYATTVERKDFGVRLALGGGAARVVRGAGADALWPVAAGALAGWLFALLGARDVVGAGADPIVFAGVPALLLIVASGACAVPAWRAVGTDVMATLREE